MTVKFFPVNSISFSPNTRRSKIYGCIFAVAMEAKNMIYVALRKKIHDLMKSKSTLLWLEGSKYEQVNHVQVKDEKVVLALENGTIKIVPFDKFAITTVGIQFWHQGKPGVLYKWDLVHRPEDDSTPPDIAA
jgi:hypothetical protein